MGPGLITRLEMVRAVVVEKREVLMAVALAVEMIWKRHAGTGRVGALEALRTAWCLILTKRARPTNTTMTVGPADVQGQDRLMTAENVGEVAPEMEGREMVVVTRVERVRVVIVTVTVTVTELTGRESAKVQSCTYPVQTVYRHLRMPDRLQSPFPSFCRCAPERDGWGGNGVLYQQFSESQLPVRS